MAWLLAGLITLLHYFGERIDESTASYQASITSFASGLTIAYIFLQLFPELTMAMDLLGDMVFLPVLCGVAVIHLAEKGIYKHEKSADAIRHDFKELHSIILLVYHLVIGVLLYQLLLGDIVRGTLFILPVLFHTAVSSLSLKELHEDILHTPTVHGAVSLAPLFGVAIASYTSIPTALFYTLLGVVTGVLLYITLRDSLPHVDKGAVMAFIVGTVSYSLLIIGIWHLI
ncbi:MAG: hypothetical protein MUP66_03060 [Candidatus Nanohaloarchaeota archaeon QJJ-5]|nr:hypothetical protein [Candidatus Nanohaloarchaeota archaeon QJJ-5]